LTPAYTPAFTHSPANVGTTKIDQVVIALGAGDIKLTVEGQPARTTRLVISRRSGGGRPRLR
jgi:hypothetical protein